jgi:hypothetical protein
MKTTFKHFEVTTWQNCHDRFNMRKVEITEIDNDQTDTLVGDKPGI